MLTTLKILNTKMKNNLPQWHDYDMGNGVIAFSTTRKGGCSEGNYAAFNINRYCGDDPAHIEANRTALCQRLGIGMAQLVVPHQVHAAEVKQIGRDFTEQPAVVRDELTDGFDAVMTDVPGICVGVSTADCIPVLIYDAAHHAVCAVHAGWRGTVQRIVVKAIERMRAVYGTQPSELTAAIGPGISIDHFEVGDEVYQQFVDAGFEMEPISRRYQKWHIDLPECNRRQLIQLGVDPQRILSSGICTYAQSDMYFSARHLGIDSGRIYNGIMLTPHRD